MSLGRKLQVVTQTGAMVLFVVLLFTGRVQLWMGIFLGSAVLTLLFGRFYCGWLCPINTVMKLITEIKTRLKLKSFAVPETLKKPVFRYGMLAAFLLCFVMTAVGGRKLPVLPVLFACGVLLTVFFPEILWHRYLCPYGTILSLPGAKAIKHLRIDEKRCAECGVCQKVCPGGAIAENGGYSITKGLCLTGLECVYHCPEQAIRYQ